MTQDDAMKKVRDTAMYIVTMWKCKSYKRSVIPDHFTFDSEKPFESLINDIAQALQAERDQALQDAAIECAQYDSGEIGPEALRALKSKEK